MDYERSEGTSFPLGSSWIESERAYNFSLYSRHAEDVVLLLYHDNDLHQPAVEYRFDFHKNKSGPIWHCRIPFSQTDGAQYYAYRINGPPPAAGYDWHAFDAEKVLIDPYARSIYIPPQFSREAACHSGSNVGRAVLGAQRRPPCDFAFRSSIQRQVLVAPVEAVRRFRTGSHGPTGSFGRTARIARTHDEAPIW